MSSGNVGWYTANSNYGNENTEMSICMYQVGSTGPMSIGGWDTHSWSVTVPDSETMYGCNWTSSSYVSVTYGWMAAEIDNSLVDGAYYDQSNTTATNGATSTRHWAAGAAWWFYNTSSLYSAAVADMAHPSNTTGGTTCPNNGYPTINLTADVPSGSTQSATMGRQATAAAPRGSGSGTVTVHKEGPASESQSATCPSGYELLHAESAHIASSVKDTFVAPDPHMTRIGARTVASPGARGNNLLQLICSDRSRDLRHLRSTVLGTAGAEDVTTDLSRATMFGGIGADTARVGQKSTAFGGKGDDRLVVTHPGGVAVGGPGQDVLKATTAGDSLLEGGYGKDVFKGAAGATRINAVDGQADIIICRSSQNRVLADPIDIIEGPCSVVK